MYCFVLLSALVVEVASFHTLSSLHSIVFTNVPQHPGDEVHSEYFLGKCSQAAKGTLVLHDHLTYEQIANHAVIRGVIENKVFNENAKPNCIYIKASSPYGDMVKYDAYKFNVCFIQIVYMYLDDQTFSIYYYEWFIPVEMHPDIDWDLYFYYVT